MDKKRDDQYILQVLDSLGIDARAERMRTEVHHLLTLFEQGKTLEEALETVSENEMRERLKPFVYCSTLRALILAGTKLGVITPEQFKDLEGYLLARAEPWPIHLER